MPLFRAIMIVSAVLASSNVKQPVFADKTGGSAGASSKKVAQKMEHRSVSARVVSTLSEGTGIRAKKIPGEFTILEGSTATNFKYHFHDPKTNVKLDKLSGSSIYSVSKGRYVIGAANSPDFSLPPGRYKFVVGGSPGAYGSLSFDVGPRTNDGGGKAIAHDLPANFKLSADAMKYVSSDGEETAVPGISKSNPLKLSYKNGRINCEHTSTIWTEPHPNTKYRDYQKTKIRGTLTRGVLSGKFIQYSTFSDHSDPTIPNGFKCNKGTMTGELSGTVDASGRLSVRVSGWTIEAFEHPYGSKGTADGPPKLFEVEPWRDSSQNYPLDFTVEFDLQLPVK